MAVDTLTKKIKELERRVVTLERTIPVRRTAQRNSASSSYNLGSYHALARLKGLLRKVKGEDPLLYQRRIRKESERILA